MTTLSSIPDDLIDVITLFMNVTTFSKFRFVYRLNWSICHVKRHGVERIKTLENRPSNYTAFGPIPFFQRDNYPLRCVNVKCHEHTISYVQWHCGHRRRWVPWCQFHVPPDIMECVECYCFGRSTRFE